ncbi:MAG: hypothetical protein II882_01465 [Lachnospiraceae bacterium]|nr:hypothetical protein [Lachnospiraceae bacterium]
MKNIGNAVKKQIIALMLTLLAGGILTACGKAAPEAGNPAEAAGREVIHVVSRQKKEAPVREGYFREDGVLYYYPGPGIPYTGWMETEQGFWYFDENGARAEGFQEIDGALYYFQDGAVLFGWQAIDGKYYLFDKTTGQAVLGWLPSEGHLIYISAEDGIIGSQTREIDGVLCTFDNHGWLISEGGPADSPVKEGSAGEQRMLDASGNPVTGYFERDGEWYYTNEDGYVLTGFQTVDGTLYHFREDGRASAAWVWSDGLAYYADFGGKLNKGFREIDGELYYFDPDSYTLVRNTQIGEYTIDSQGICRINFGEITKENLKEYVAYLLDRYGSTPLEIYTYVVENYTFRFKEKEDTETMAIRMFNAGYGACWDFAAVTEYLLEAAGYRCRWVIGESGLRESHDWLLVEMEPGVWRHMDTMRRQYFIYNLTDDELAAYDGVAGSYVWDRTKWTSTTSTGTGGDR